MRIGTWNLQGRRDARHLALTWERQVVRTKDLTRSGLLRGGWALIYAHWGGYVKNSGMAYLEWVSRKGLKLKDLRDELAAIAMRSDLQKMAEEKNPESHALVVKLLRHDQSRPADLRYDQAMIRTNSNLKFKGFTSIMHGLGCDASQHAAHEKFIDVKLLKWRNGIAHGRQEYIELGEWTKGHDVVLEILRDVRTQIANAAVLDNHLR